MQLLAFILRSGLGDSRSWKWGPLPEETVGTAESFTRDARSSLSEKPAGSLRMWAGSSQGLRNILAVLGLTPRSEHERRWPHYHRRAELEVDPVLSPGGCCPVISDLTGVIQMAGEEVCI